MRFLKNFISEHLQNAQSTHPNFQWSITAIIIAISILLIRTGWNGYKQKRLEFSRGKIMAGFTAQTLGVTCIILGSAIMTIMIAFNL